LVSRAVRPDMVCVGNGGSGLAQAQMDEQFVLRAKAQARAEARERLRAAAPARLAEWSQKVCAKLGGHRRLREAGSVMLFLPRAPDPDLRAQSYPEVDLRPLAEELLSRGVSVYLPGVDWENSELTPRRIRSIDKGLQVRRYGVYEPPNSAEPLDAGKLDVILAPGVAFDARGGRVGHGAGMYDRLLSRADLPAWVCGAAFEAQVLDRIPMGPNDVRLDAAATERRLLLFPGARNEGRE
jgi:5-formyltetrahydrofolate cyclo-ligase